MTRTKRPKRAGGRHVRRRKLLRAQEEQRRRANSPGLLIERYI